MKHMLLVVAALATANPAQADTALHQQAARLFGQIKPATDTSSPQAELGRALFWDPRASADGKTACASCHAAADWGADHRRFSPDARGALTSRHAPTVFNSMTQPMLRWLGDRKDGVEQAQTSLTGSMGFASMDAGVMKLVELAYVPAFRAAFPGEKHPLTATNYGRALAAYQATLATPAPFDHYLAGDERAMTERQKAGLRRFISTGCAGCHYGANLGGLSLQKFGVINDYWPETKSEKPDVGRFAVTKNEQDRYVFRVPMLRNVAKTAPYFHDGSVERLDQAVRIMANLQLGLTLDETAAGDIVAFLGALTGAVPANYAPPAQRPGL